VWREFAGVFRPRMRRLASFTSLTVRPGSVSLGCLANHLPRNRLPLTSSHHTTPVSPHPRAGGVQMAPHQVLGLAWSSGGQTSVDLNLK